MTAEVAELEKPALSTPRPDFVECKFGLWVWGLEAQKAPTPARARAAGKMGDRLQAIWGLF